MNKRPLLDDATRKKTKQELEADAIVRNYFEKTMGGNIDDIYENLVVNGSPKKTISEYDFVNYFLPLFSGEKKYSDPKEGNVVSVWINKVSGSEFVPVDVVSGNGEVLFTVPPMTDPGVINSLISRRGNNLNSMGAMASRLSQTALPGTASNYELDYIDKNLESYLRIEGGMDQPLDAWDIIFKRYKVGKYRHVETKEDTTVPVDTPKATKTEERYVYDENELVDDEL